jgi:hypothetical protein
MERREQKRRNPSKMMMQSFSPIPKEGIIIDHPVLFSRISLCLYHKFHQKRTVAKTTPINREQQQQQHTANSP